MSRLLESGRGAVGALAAIAIAASLLAACSSARPGGAVAAPASVAAQKRSHVIVLLMENEEATSVLGNPQAPYANSLIRRYGLATRSYAIAHPSLPNYLALTSGSTHGIGSDCTDCTVSAANIVDRLEAAHTSWKAYMEGLPHPCFEGAQAGGYAKKHDPFMYYDDVASSPARCRHIVGFGALSSDLRVGTLPTYAWISPNLCDDGHDCGVSGGDRFLTRTVPSLIRALGPHGFLVITWDEGASDQGCCGGVAAGGRVATIVVGPDVRPGARLSQPLDHYGVLATVESALGLAPLAAAADPANGSLQGLFTRPARLR
ncbi:MAG TPA: alkaline phosphatase family protein [Solirubrobacteraceae bacterium]|nr:alkaline phosphatase family protein [Solirubrobacteraceae bacterium]